MAAVQPNGRIAALWPRAGGDESTVCVCVRVRAGWKRAGVCWRMFSILPWVAFGHVTADVSWHRTRRCDSGDAGKVASEGGRRPSGNCFAAFVSPRLKLKELCFFYGYQ